MIYYIENQFLKVGIDSYRCTLNSVFDKTAEEELLWQGEKRSWIDSDVVIFPLIARLNDKYYQVDGKKYSMDIHGVAYYSQFEVFSQNADSITFVLKSDKATLLQYPFNFKLYVTRYLTGKSLTTTLTVENTDTKTLPCCLGAHPAFKLSCKDLGDSVDTSDNYIVFDKPQTLKTYVLNEKRQFIAGICEEAVTYSRLQLSKKLFENDAVMFSGFRGGISLVKGDGRTIHFDLGEPPVLAFWSHPTFGGYVCVEPWLGLPDTDPPTRELKDKPLINLVEPQKNLTYTFKITI